MWFTDVPRQKYVSQQVSTTRTMWLVDARHWQADDIIGSSSTLIGDDSIHCSATCRSEDATSPCAGPQLFNTLSNSTQSVVDAALWVTGSTTAEHNTQMNECIKVLLFWTKFRCINRSRSASPPTGLQPIAAHPHVCIIAKNCCLYYPQMAPMHTWRVFKTWISGVRVSVKSPCAAQLMKVEKWVPCASRRWKPHHPRLLVCSQQQRVSIMLSVWRTDRDAACVYCDKMQVTDTQLIITVFW